MKREIKFRAREVKTNKWVYFTLEDLVNTGYNFDELKDWCEDTGLKDKNEKEIFEGDVVVYDHCTRVVNGIVKYNESECCYFLDIIGKNEFEVEHFNPSRGLEIIGNIYENPELLKANK